MCREGQRVGIWAWDVASGELVLVIPVVLALLGDNPMQSEMACHIGLRGKFFCRVCWVKGRDAEDELGAIPLPANPIGEEVDDAASTLPGSTVDGLSLDDDSTSRLSSETDGEATTTPRSPNLPAADATRPASSDFNSTRVAEGPATPEAAIAEQTGRAPQRVRKGRALESLQQLADRARRFLGVTSSGLCWASCTDGMLS